MSGAPARIAALNASLRPYRPNYLHLWRLKTYWDSDTLSEQAVGLEQKCIRALQPKAALHVTDASPLNPLVMTIDAASLVMRAETAS